jgi:hypothetical protein
VKAADITQPEPIVIGSGPRPRTFHWERLDPAKAQYGAVWGLRGPQGFAAIIWDHPAYEWPSITLCGLMTASYPEGLEHVRRDLEHIVRTGRNDDSDDRISKARFESWK